MKQFLGLTGGLWAQGKTVNKVVRAMSSEQNSYGDQEATMFSFYKAMYHWGAIIAPPDYTNEVMQAGMAGCITRPTVSTYLYEISQFTSYPLLYFSPCFQKPYNKSEVNLSRLIS